MTHFPPASCLPRSTRLPIGLIAALAWAAAGATSAGAATSIDVSFDDANGTYASYYAPIRANVASAGDEWIALFGLQSTPTRLQVQVDFSPVLETATGASFAANLLGVVDGLSLYEQGAAYKLRTGIDSNGTAADIRIELGSAGYLQNELWFDPTPAVRTADVPIDRTDARSIFLHEFGHAFGFNGWRDGVTGALPGAYESTFDKLTVPCANAAPLFCFTGPHAEAVYGGQVPLTYGAAFHVGNPQPVAGADLLGDLMNGVEFDRGIRYGVSGLDLAILQDVGAFVSPVPEPSSLALMLAGLGLVAAVSRRKRPVRLSARTGTSPTSATPR